MKKSNMYSATIRMTVVTVFILATSVTATLSIGLQYYFGHSLARTAAQDLYTVASSNIANELRHVGKSTANVIEMLADNPVLQEPLKTEAQRQLFTKAIMQNSMFYGVYLGRGDGSFFEVINLNASETARNSLRAVPTDRWVLVSVDGQGSSRQRHYTYMDERFITRLTRSENTDFDVTTRPWYINAMGSNDTQSSTPYIFAQLQTAGQTLSKRLERTDTVIGIDRTLSTMSTYLREQNFSKKGEVFVYQSDGKILATSVEGMSDDSKLPIPQLQLSAAEIDYIQTLPPLKVSNEMNWPPFDYALSGQPRGYTVDIIKMISGMTGIKLQFVNGYDWPELVDEFKRRELDMLQPVSLANQNAEWGVSTDSLVTTPYAVVTRSGAAPITALDELNGKSVSIPAGWSIIPLITEYFPDIVVVEAGSSFDAIRMVLDDEVDATLDTEVILRYVSSHHFLVDIQFHTGLDFGVMEVPDTLHIVLHENEPKLLAIINKAIAALGPVQREYLRETWLEPATEKDTLNTDIAPRAMVNIAGDDSLQGRLIEVQYRGQPHFSYVAPLSASGTNPNYFGILVPTEAVVGPFMDKVKLSALITAAFLFMLLPLSWFFANPIVRPIRQLATENDKVRRRQYDSVQRVESNIRELDELSDSMVAMVAAIKAHEIAQTELMDSFIRLIAQAIDDKSAYTGGHCERVPVLALMLAEHASNSEEAAFREFKLETEDEWREYRIAAWLHDCGKITTPEHIVDKGTKLETIYNRIHEVRMRFEVLLRDAKIHYLTQLIKNPERDEEFKRELEHRRQQIQDDFAFVAQCNVGGEFLDQEKQERLRAIAEQTWIRNLSDRIGLSPPEELRTTTDELQLPATENLLSDKPEHIIERTRSTEYAPALGIDMDVPVHLYNLGEVYNLSISRGTLTNEDRFKINEHMISTIKMLEGLPFPPELAKVPRYASTHHETMRGSGYPRKLGGDQLSIPERILAVSDVFEALTASDRPYKKAKPISVAVDILHKMVEDKHLDKDCFELFLKNKVYLQYASDFLPDTQIDDVDIGKYGVH